MISEVFGKKIKALREEGGFTQTGLAEQFGMNLRQIQRYENGLVPPMELLKDLCDFFKYNFLRLFEKEWELTEDRFEVSEDLIPYGGDKTALIKSLKESLADKNEIITQLKTRIGELESKQIRRSA